jgi:hypothetical protein
MIPSVAAHASGSPSPNAARFPGAQVSLAPLVKCSHNITGCSPVTPRGTKIAAVASAGSPRSWVR